MKNRTRAQAAARLRQMADELERGELTAVVAQAFPLQPGDSSPLVFGSVEDVSRCHHEAMAAAGHHACPGWPTYTAYELQEDTGTPYNVSHPLFAALSYLADLDHHSDILEEGERRWVVHVANSGGQDLAHLHVTTGGGQMSLTWEEVQ